MWYIFQYDIISYIVFHLILNFISDLFQLMKNILIVLLHIYKIYYKFYK